MRFKQSRRLSPSAFSPHKQFEEAPLDLTCKRFRHCATPPQDSLPDSSSFKSGYSSPTHSLEVAEIPPPSSATKLDEGLTSKSSQSAFRFKLKRKSSIRPFKAYKVSTSIADSFGEDNRLPTGASIANSLPASNLPNKPSPPRSRNLSSSVSLVSTGSDDPDDSNDDTASSSSASRQGNPRMKRHPDMTPREKKNDVYWDRRRKNNEAAKKSRQTRRVKEDEMTVRANLIERDNYRLKGEILAVQAEINTLQFLVCQ